MLFSDLCGTQNVRISVRGTRSASRVTVFVVPVPRHTYAVPRALAAYTVSASGTATGVLNFPSSGSWRATADYVGFIVVDEGNGSLVGGNSSNFKIEGGPRTSSAYACPGG
jgi:hypothetical protein